MRQRLRRGAIALVLVLAAVIGPSVFPAYADAVPTAPPVPAVTSVVDIGPLQQNPAILGRDNARSARFGALSVWTFGDTPLRVQAADGDHWSDNTISWTRDQNAADGLSGWTDYVDAAGAPAEFLPLTADEKAFNDAHAGDNCATKPCNAELALWPGEIVADPARNRLLVFYAEIYRVGGQPNFTVVGNGIATWTPAGPVVRPIESPGSSNPTLMFGPTGFGSGNGSVVVGTYLYNYGCFPQWLLMRCQLARVPLAQALDRSAWRYYAGNGSWVSSQGKAVVVFDGGAAGTSVAWNPALQCYLAIYSPAFTDDVMYRVSSSPAGPWSEAALLFHGLPGWNGNPDYASAAHPEFALSNGRTQYVTYVRTTGLLQQEIRQVLVTFAAPAA